MGRDDAAAVGWAGTGFGLCDRHFSRGPAGGAGPGAPAGHADHTCRPDGIPRAESAFDHRHRQAARRGPADDPAQPRRLDLPVHAQRHLLCPAWRAGALEPGAATRARRGAGQLRPDPRARRSRQSAVPAGRRAAARGHVAVHQCAGHAVRQQDGADHRRSAGAVRLPHRWHHRHHAEVRPQRSRRRGQHDRRLLQLAAAGAELWRQQRQERLVRHRPVPAQRHRRREPPADGLSDPRRDRPVACARQGLAHHRREHACVVHPGRRPGALPDSAESRL